LHTSARTDKKKKIPGSCAIMYPGSCGGGVKVSGAKEVKQVAATKVGRIDNSVQTSVVRRVSTAGKNRSGRVEQVERNLMLGKANSLEKG